MQLNNQDIKQLEKVKRLNIINSITGVKPANLIGTINNLGQTNLAIISSVVHLSSDPPLIGFVMRPHGEVKRDTYLNILANKSYTINHVHTKHIAQAHRSSAKFDTDVSEFEKCEFTPQYIKEFIAPFVAESNIKIGMKFIDEIFIKQSRTTLIIGEIEHLILPDEFLSKEGYIKLADAEVAGIGGLNSYYKLSHLADFSYARPEDSPNF